MAQGCNSWALGMGDEGGSSLPKARPSRLTALGSQPGVKPANWTVNWFHLCLEQLLDRKELVDCKNLTFRN